MVEYRFRISGVHYAANPEAEAGMPDTEEMHVRTREMLSWIDREATMARTCRARCRTARNWRST